MKAKTDQLKVAENPILEESDPDCSCELLDTSLSGVGDSECSCSECLEANLQAFNELKQLEEERQSEIENKLTRRASSRVTLPRQPRTIDRNLSTNDQRTKTKVNDYQSINKTKQNQQKLINKAQANSTANLRQQIQQPETGPFSRSAINDYLKITQYRAREYLDQRKKLQKSEKVQREKLKEMIKMNLQELKFTVAAMRQEGKQEKEGQFDPDYKWNHQPYHCKSRVECRKRMPYNPDLDNKQQEIEKIKERIRKYEEKHKKEKYQCPDQCPSHHLRTSKKKLAEIEKYIKSKAKAYEEKKKKQKAEKYQQQRVKAAKIRAIDIRCRDIVAKSKKIDPNISRTSFHLTIDHFSTFSDLRQANAQRLQLKQKKRKIRKAMKEGGFLEEQIYENLSENLIGDHPPIHSRLEAESRFDQRQNEESQQWCQKIVKEARIKPPKDVKHEDKLSKNPKKQERQFKQSGRQANHTKPKKQAHKNLRKEEERRRELQLEIDRKKQEIFKEYQKRNTTAKIEKGKNKKIRMQYQQSLRDQKSPSSKPSAHRKQQPYDSYRQVYHHQPSKDPRQMKVVGDPLMHEYEYEKSAGRWKEMQVEEDREIFTKSGSSLKNKQYLKV